MHSKLPIGTQLEFNGNIQWEHSMGIQLDFRLGTTVMTVGPDKNKKSNVICEN